MKTTLSRLLLPIVLITTSLLGGCTMTDVREHKELNQISPRIRSITILPPDVKVQKINFTGENEILTEKQNEIAATLTRNLAQKLRSAKLDVKTFDFTSTSAENPDFAYAVTQCKKAFNEAEKTLYAKPVEAKNKASFNSSIGGLGNHIANTVGVDAFVIVEYDGYEKSAGMIAKDVAAGVLMGVLLGAVPMSPASGSAVTVGIIDADSGDILWTNRKANPRLDAAVLEIALREMPKTSWSSAPKTEITTTATNDAVSVTNAVEAAVPASVPTP